jgi:hypothetical protein
MFLQAVFRPSAELLEIPSGFGNPDHRNVQVSSFYHGLQGREYLLVGEISRGAEEN